MQKSKQTTTHTQYVLPGLEPRFYELIKSCGSKAQTIINYSNSLRNEITLSHNYERNNMALIEQWLTFLK